MMYGDPHLCYIILGYRWYVHLTNEFSRFSWIYILKEKSDCKKAFLLLKEKVVFLIGRCIKVLQSDGAREYDSLNNALTLAGITRKILCPYTLEQNGLVERKHRHIVEIGLSMLA